MAGRRREVDQLLKLAQRQRCEVTRAKSGHWKVTHPASRDTVTVAHSPSDYHAVRNARADLRRTFGIDV